MRLIATDGLTGWLPMIAAGKAPYASVPIHKWMNRLELVVDERELNEQRQRVTTLSDIPLEVIQRLVHFTYRRRDESCGGWRGTARPDEVRYSPELPRPPFLSAGVSHQTSMDLTDH